VYTPNVFCVILQLVRPSSYSSENTEHLLPKKKNDTGLEQLVNHPFKHKIWTAWTCYFFFYSIFATVYSRVWISEDKFGLSNCAESILAIVITPAKVCYALCKINTKINHPQSTLCVQVHLVRGWGKQKKRVGGREEKWANVKKKTAPHLIDELDLLFLDANFHLIYKNMLEW